MDPTAALMMLAGIYYGCMYGGAVTAILINTPGDAAAVMTTLDGYPLARQGRAGAALSIAADELVHRRDARGHGAHLHGGAGGAISRSDSVRPSTSRS